MLLVMISLAMYRQLQRKPILLWKMLLIFFYQKFYTISKTRVEGVIQI